MRKKILWISQGIIALILLIYALLSSQVYYNGHLDIVKQNLVVYMNLYNKNEYTMNNEGAEEFARLYPGMKVMFLDTRGNVLGSSEEVSDGEKDNYIENEDVAEAIKKDSGYSVHHGKSIKKNMVYYCKQMEKDNNFCLVRIAMPVNSEWNAFQSIRLH